MIMFYSGARSKAVSPETTLKKFRASIMLTFWEMTKKGSKSGTTLKRFDVMTKRARKEGTIKC
jgi:hypothetical protein